MSVAIGIDPGKKTGFGVPKNCNNEDVMEKILKRKDGTRVKISVDFYESRGKLQWKISVHTCGKRKRKFLPVFDSNCYVYRRLGSDGRSAHIREKQDAVTTPEERQEILSECWMSLRPHELMADTY